jgi:hypothetical protein
MTKVRSVAAIPSGAAVIAQQLVNLGVVRQAEESLADTTARAMGLTNGQLRAELERMAASSAG